MKLYLLKAIEGAAAFYTWYDKQFGVVVRALNEEDARIIAGLSEGSEPVATWLDSTQTSCTELSVEGKAGLILQDFKAS